MAEALSNQMTENSGGHDMQTGRASVWKKHHAAGNVVDGDKIRELREEKGMTHAQFAQKCDMTAHNLIRIENGEGNTSTGKIRSMADVLGVQPAMLINGVEELIADEIGHLRDLTMSSGVRTETEPVYDPSRDIALIRAAFAGNDPAYLQVGTLKTDVPEEVLGDILHIVTAHKLKRAGGADLDIPG